MSNPSEQGTTYTQTVYECSRDSAAIKVDNTHWINQFSEGIKLKKGDQVRLLGSFVQEGANSNEIEISEDQEVNISYSPYLLGNTIDTIDKSENGNLIDLSSIGDIPYSTDAYGIEPPMRNTDQQGIENLNQLYPNKHFIQNNMANGVGPPYPNDSGTVAAQSAVPSPNRGWQGPHAEFNNVATTTPTATGENGGDIYGHYEYNPWFINGSTPGQQDNPVYTGGNTVGTMLQQRPSMRKDSATTWGMNIETDSFNTDPAIHNRLARDYSRFTDNDVPTEMYVGHMVKKFILPVIDNFVTFNTDADPTGAAAEANIADAQYHNLEDLIPDAAASGQPGCLAGAPKVGQFICTVDIAQSSGWYDSDGIGYFENKWGTEVAGNNANFAGAEEIDFLNEQRPKPNPAWRFAGAAGNTGIPNLKSGAQSVIGEIIAVRAIKKHILGSTTNCYEIYVSNFINPATIKGTTSISHTFDATEVTNGTNFAVNTGPKTLYKMTHGSATLENGYNYNPSFNTINGADNTVTCLNATRYGTELSMKGGYLAGQNSGTPLGLSYIANTTYSPSPALSSAYTTGGDSVQANQREMGICNPQGLSFLWNGTHTGYRKTKFTASNYNRFRANSLMEPYRTNTAAPSPLNIKHLIQDNIYKFRTPAFPTIPNPTTTFTSEKIRKQQGSVPVCLGAYVICNRDTMLDIAKGNLDSRADNDYYSSDPNRSPRIWLDWGFQARQSDYNTRHFVGNSWDTTNTLTTNGTALTSDSRFPNGLTTYHNERRYGYSWMGRPNNINFRKSVVNNGSTNPVLPGQLQSAQFSVPAYTTTWLNNAAAQSMESDDTPIYLSTVDGLPILPNNNTQTMRGLPAIWGGYNTCINSVYFQQKDSGDTKLGLDSWRIKSTVTGGGVIGTNTISISSLNTINVDTGLIDNIPNVVLDTTGQYQLKVLQDDRQFNPVEIITNMINQGDGTFLITLANTNQTNGAVHNDAKFMQSVSQGVDIIIYYKSGGGCGAGVNATPWSSDMIMIKESVAKFKVPAGYYTEEQLAEELNNALHYDIKTYKKEYGVKDADNNYSIPSNVGLLETARTSQPSVKHGMFVQTYIPDISYGFTPITTTNAAALEQEAQTKDLTTELMTYDNTFTLLGTEYIFDYYYPEEYLLNPALAYNGTTRRRVTDHSTAYPTAIGKHVKFYSVPHTPIIQGAVDQQKELCLIRLKGGALLKSDFDGSGTSPTYRWNNKDERMVGNMEMLRATDICVWDDTAAGTTGNQNSNPTFQSTQGQYMYRTRLTRNLFPNGGSARVLVGATDATISWEEGANRFSLNKLYTPLRPHESESGGTNKEFGIDDAVPSAIICSKHTGKTIGALTGIYINDLNANAFTQENWGLAPIGDHFLYDVDSNEQVENVGQALMTILGYNKEQIDAFNNSFNLVTDPFVYKDDTLQDGKAVRIGPKITPAINCQNPVASKCLNIAPVQQFFVQVDTDDFFSEDVPLKGSSPYYFIGSNFPSKQFYGNLNGSKLPIVGICSRNFSAFNYVFDLGGSAISFLIDEDTTITHIETKIFDSNLKTPTNLSPSSSVIYLITRYNYAKPITNPQEIQLQAEKYIQESTAPIINDFYSQPTANIRTSLPAIIPPSNSPYFTGFGQMLPPIPEGVDLDDSDSD